MPRSERYAPKLPQPQVVFAFGLSETRVRSQGIKQYLRVDIDYPPVRPILQDEVSTPLPDGAGVDEADGNAATACGSGGDAQARMAVRTTAEEGRDGGGRSEAAPRWTQMEDGPEKLAAFFHETARIRRSAAQTESESIPSQGARISWKLVSVLLVFSALAAWSVLH